MVLDQVTFEELWEAMYALEPAAADGAARRRTEADIAALEQNLVETRAALADPCRSERYDPRPRDRASSCPEPTSPRRRS
ncbi:FCD domain-containing protein [Paracoccus mutanolyticus]|uniref:FCD domain-containing protein n=1 Tax=Paracoccus mutanolyticus TaxID=1499308 RepID=UPI001CB9CEA6